jgi:hypothetical protein
MVWGEYAIVGSNSGMVEHDGRGRACHCTLYGGECDGIGRERNCTVLMVVWRNVMGESM